jgi:hypothetical protein
MRRLMLAVFAICVAGAMARAQSSAPIPIPLCPIEGADVFRTDGLLSAGATNCQPQHNTDVEYAQCWSREPDALIPAWLVECACRKGLNDFAPGLIPGNYAIAGSGPCAPGVAAVITSLVGERWWGVDGGCDGTGDQCAMPTSVSGAMLFSSIDAPVTKQLCRVDNNGKPHCRFVE